MSYLTNQEEDMLFADKGKFVDVPSEHFQHAATPVGQNMRETFTSSTTLNGNFYAHIPQDFNVDIETTGNIVGMNPGDSKLLALTARMTSLNGSVTARRVKADDCVLQSGPEALV